MWTAASGEGRPGRAGSAPSGALQRAPRVRRVPAWPGARTAPAAGSPAPRPQRRPRLSGGQWLPRRRACESPPRPGPAALRCRGSTAGRSPLEERGRELSPSALSQRPCEEPREDQSIYFLAQLWPASHSHNAALRGRGGCSALPPPHTRPQPPLSSSTGALHSYKACWLHGFDFGVNFPKTPLKFSEMNSNSAQRRPFSLRGKTKPRAFNISIHSGHSQTTGTPPSPPRGSAAASRRSHPRRTAPGPARSSPPARRSSAPCRSPAARSGRLSSARAPPGAPAHGCEAAHIAGLSEALAVFPPSLFCSSFHSKLSELTAPNSPLSCAHGS
ncbi:alanine and proline-rich secreted protein Apa-like [Cyrtonyx montezumae]|uniref:alanine and proline-rich secreted protein Apa-like n=1 Tax=Cyrtonyx montezumae TaxID=9017 RepID=UPI0032D9FD61